MISLGQPSDLQSPKTKRYICVLAYYQGSDFTNISCDHVFTRALGDEDAYDSREMADLEGKHLALGHTLVNNYVAEV